MHQCEDTAHFVEDCRGIVRQCEECGGYLTTAHMHLDYVGHAETWDELAIDGDIAARDCMLRYKRGGRVLAVASIHRDLESLKAELTMER